MHRSARRAKREGERNGDVASFRAEHQDRPNFHDVVVTPARCAFMTKKAQRDLQQNKNFVVDCSSPMRFAEKFRAQKRSARPSDGEDVFLRVFFENSMSDLAFADVQKCPKMSGLAHTSFYGSIDSLSIFINLVKTRQNVRTSAQTRLRLSGRRDDLKKRTHFEPTQNDVSKQPTRFWSVRHTR